MNDSDSVRETAFNATVREAASLVASMIRHASADPLNLGDAARETVALGLVLACAQAFERDALDLGAFWTEHNGQSCLAVPTTLSAETLGKAHGLAQSMQNAINVARAIDQRANESLARSFNPNCLH